MDFEIHNLVVLLVGLPAGVSKTAVEMLKGRKFLEVKMGIKSKRRREPTFEPTQVHSDIYEA